MTRSPRILFALPVVAAFAAFWLLVLSPKHEEASELETKATDLRSQVEEQEQLASAAEAAREDFPRAYRRLVVLGKATPTDDDTSSLLVQLQGVADNANVEFEALTAQEGSSEAAPAPAAQPQTPAQTADSSEHRVDAAEGETASSPPAPTEATAALLPIGATIGPAGLPVMKYTLSFNGDFFRLADFVAGLDDLVDTRRDGHIGIKGRLITIDTFDLTPAGDPGKNPELSAEFQITTFLTPAEEGVTGGASPTGPAPAAQPQPAAAPAPAPPTETASATTP